MPPPARRDLQGQLASLLERVDALENRRRVSIGTTVGAGSMMFFAGTGAVPAGFLLADGAAVSRADYSALFAEIGVTYGAGNGSTTFNLPNMEGRVPVGLDASQAEFTPLGKTGGAKTHTLTVNEMPHHSHGGDGGRIWSEYGSGSLAAGSEYGGILRATTAATGNDQAHNNLQPYLVGRWIIAY